MNEGQSHDAVSHIHTLQQYQILSSLMTMGSNRQSLLTDKKDAGSWLLLPEAKGCGRQERVEKLASVATDAVKLASPQNAAFERQLSAHRL